MLPRSPEHDRNVGTLLLAAAILVLIRRSANDLEYRPVIWALVALLILKIVSGPDLSEPSGVLWMSLGLLSRSVLISESRGAVSPDPSTAAGDAEPVAGDLDPPARPTRL